MSVPASGAGRSPTVAIVGGGISGLSAAYYLAERGADCTLIESSDRLGGVIRTNKVEGCLVEAGPDSFLAQKPWALDLIREIGLEGEVIGSNDSRRRTFVLNRGRLVDLPDGVQFMAPTRIWPMVRTPMLSLEAKLRMAAEWLRRPRGDSPDRSVAEFVIDHYGSEVNEVLAQPMLAGVYGGAPEDLSVQAVLPRFVELERRYGSLSRGLARGMRQARSKATDDSSKRKSLFLTLRGGMQQLVDRLEQRLEGRVRRIQATARGLSTSGVEWRVRLDEQTLRADAVVLAVPAHAAAALVSEAGPELSPLLGSIPYGSSITAALIYRRPGFNRPLDGFGFLAPRREGRLLSACTWVNTKFDHRAPEERPLLRAFVSGAGARRAAGQTAQELVGVLHNELADIMNFDAPLPVGRIARWDRAMAQYPVGHAEIVEAIDARAAALPGLHLAGNAYRGIGIPDCIRLSRTLADAIVAT